MRYIYKELHDSRQSHPHNVQTSNFVIHAVLWIVDHDIDKNTRLEGGIKNVFASYKDHGTFL